MKKIVISLLIVVLTTAAIQSNSIAQKATPKKKQQVIDSKAIDKPDEKVAAFTKLNNVKDKLVEKSRGDVYGDNLSDIVVDNYTGYYIDIYVDGSYRGTLVPYDKKVTWAVPGRTTLYAKAEFTDSSYKYWWPTSAVTGYEYKWNLRN